MEKQILNEDQAKRATFGLRMQAFLFPKRTMSPAEKVLHDMLSNFSKKS